MRPGVPTVREFALILATLSLLAALADERPLLCLIDDAQWLDSASVQVLGFVARRLLAESVAMVFAVREPSDERELVGLVFYHGWTQEQTAELFGVSVRTVQRRWQTIMVKLHALVQPE